MIEAKRCIKWLAFYYFLLVLNMIPESGIIPFEFPINRISSIYLLTLSVCLYLRYYARVAGGKRLKNTMQHLAAMIFLLLLLRGIKYSVFVNDFFWGRYTWYLYYLPMLCMPMLLFFVSLYVYARDEKQVMKKWGFVIVVTLILVVLVLTNDLHQQVFLFQPGFENWDSDYSYRWGFIVVTIWEYLLYTAAVFILILRYPIVKIRWWSWLIFVPFFIGITILILLTINKMPTINGRNIIEVPENLCFMAAGALECGIQLGLIPTNESHGKIFQVSHVSAQITDYSGTPVYRSLASVGLTPEQFEAEDGSHIAEHTILHRVKLPGGYGFWQDDVTELDRLNGELMDARERLSEETELIRLQNELERNRNIIEQRSILYDTIAKRTQKQSQLISLLAEEALALSESEESGKIRRSETIEINRKRIVLLGAYIKRYANLMLLSSEKQFVDSGELALSISEVLRYLNLFGTSVEVIDRSGCTVPSNAALIAFEAFHEMIEENLFSLKGVSVNLIDRKDSFVLRITFEGFHKDQLPEDLIIGLSDAGVKQVVQKEDEITYLSLVLQKGGEAS